MRAMLKTNCLMESVSYQQRPLVAAWFKESVEKGETCREVQDSVLRKALAHARRPGATGREKHLIPVLVAIFQERGDEVEAYLQDMRGWMELHPNMRHRKIVMVVGKLRGPADAHQAFKQLG